MARAKKAEQEPKPRLVKAYITGTAGMTSVGRLHHGDRAELPEDEFMDLKRRGLAQHE